MNHAMKYVYTQCSSDSRQNMLAKLILVFGLPIALGHEMKFGACPEVEVVDNFSFDKMMGLWYVIQQTSTSSSCVTLNFKNDDKKGKVVEESLKPLGLSIPKYFESFDQTGTLRVPSPNFQSKMKVAFPYSIIPNTEVDFWIMDTDYKTYAAIWSCRGIAFGHRQLAMILSRTPTLDQAIVKKMRDKFEFHNVNPHSFSIISHKACNQKGGKSDNSGTNSNGNTVADFGTSNPTEEPDDDDGGDDGDDEGDNDTAPMYRE